MNQKQRGLGSVVIILVVLFLVGIAVIGCYFLNINTVDNEFSLEYNQSAVENNTGSTENELLPETKIESELMKIEIPSFPSKIDVSGVSSEPSDQALAEITVLSQTGNDLKISIDKIRDYIRYPKATNPQLKAGNTISISFNDWLDTYKDDGKVCPVGYTRSLITEKTVPANQVQPQRVSPVIIVGEKYLAKLRGCFQEGEGFTCGISGWSVQLYNPYPIFLEYECIAPSSTDRVIPSDSN
ncbi:MAG: hypothetical protein WC319_05065 [Candidatus Paceibacterota bacterium]